jgi:hypothetical protein
VAAAAAIPFSLWSPVVPEQSPFRVFLSFFQQALHPLVRFVLKLTSQETDCNDMASSTSSFFSALSSKTKELADSLGSKTKELAGSVGAKSKEMASSVSNKAGEMLKGVQESSLFGKKEEHASSAGLSASLKRAAVVGVSYSSPASGQAPLPDTIKSAEAMKALLVNHFGYLDQNVVVLRDDGRESGPTFSATRANILNACSWLASDLRPGERIVQ